MSSVAGMLIFLMSGLLPQASAEGPSKAEGDSAREDPHVYVIPIRDAIMPHLSYLVRRGVKEAMEAEADFLLLDMATDGGRVDTTQEIIEILERFPGETATFVNPKAFSAGAFISVATQRIYMSPHGVIGAAAPVMSSPGGGAQGMSETMERKIVSALSAVVRSRAEKNGHNVEVVEAMIDREKELVVDGEVLAAKGELLTLTAREAAQEYGDPPRPLLSAGTVESIDQVLEREGLAGAQQTVVSPTGVERLASWINQVRPLLLLVGLLGLYLEFKTPGFGVPGFLGLAAFAVYFFGNFVAGLSGMEWLALFLLGVILLAVELFVIPGTIVVGVLGGGLMLLALLMAGVDVYPGPPSLPSVSQFHVPLRDLGIAFLAMVALALALGHLLPKTSAYQALVSQSVSGEHSTAEQEARHEGMIGQVGVTLSVLAPGGRARFGDQIVDVVSHGEMLSKGQKVRVVGHSGYNAVVEPTD